MNSYYGRFRCDENNNDLRSNGFTYEGVVIVQANNKAEAYELISKRLNETLYGADSLLSLHELKSDVVLIHSEEGMVL